MNILGISCYFHDAAAVLISDGKILAAAEEERFSRIKHDSDFPKQSINFCLKAANLNSNNIDYVIFYEKPFRKFHRILISSLSTYPKSYASFSEAMRIWLTKKLWVKNTIASFLDIKPDKILFCQHHLSHAASCFYPSAFKEAAILTLDGVGEWETGSIGTGYDNKITIVKELYYPNSIGLLYSTFTAFLGFEVNEGEWKVMGLAPYGRPIYTGKIWKLIEKHIDGSFSLDFSYFSYHYSDSKSFSDKFIEIFGSPIPPDKSHLIDKRAADLAASIQAITEDLIIHMAKSVKKITKMRNLCFSGGVALNSVANYKLLKSGLFDNIYIQPACGDSGGAMGAALYLYHHILKNKKRFILDSPLLGQEFDNSEIEQFLKDKNVRYQKLSNSKLLDYCVDKIIQGKVVGWFQGRFEWGPRALGARSILADPRNPKMKDIINAKVKFREAFRPFAPSVLGDYADEVYDLPKNYENHYPLRFMLYVVPVKSSWRNKVPAITHVDSTSRPHLVFDKNSLYYKLIKTFFQKTGIPLLLNTSFNLRGEPIVATPADAYSTFIRSGIDVLVLGNYLIKNKIK